jgi:site-specific DNA-cytosine methylase
MNNVLSLFDGISCGQQALNRAGIKYDKYYASEIDKYAIKITMANYPDTIQLGSVVDIDTKKLPTIDLLIGGSPCQSFSFAGKRKGMSTIDNVEILTIEHYLKLKEEQYEFQGQSYLFWEYMRILKEVKPKYFLLENVMMGEKWEKVLTKAIGVKPIKINSSLVSAQNRERLYWTNIGMKPAGLFGDMESTIEQPKDKKILLKDILQQNPEEKYYLSEKMINGFLEHNRRHIEEKNQTGFNWKPTTGEKKANCLRANAALCATDNSIIVHNTMPRSSKTGKGGTGPLSREDGKTYCLDTNSSTNVIEVKGLTEERTEEAKKIRNELVERKDDKIGALLTSPTPTNFILEKREVKQVNQSKESGGKQPYQQNRVYDVNGISPALCANKSDLLIKNDIVAMRGRKNEEGEYEQQIEKRNDEKTNSLTTVNKDNLVQTSIENIYAGDFRYDEGFRWRESGKTPTLMARSREDISGPPLVNTSRIRRLTPLECERLQTVDENYTNHVSDSQRYKCLGNGWTVDVIAHIFSYIKNEKNGKDKKEIHETGKNK